MGKPRQLSAEELAGAEEIPPPARAPRKLSAAELAGAQEIGDSVRPATADDFARANTMLAPVGQGTGVKPATEATKDRATAENQARAQHEVTAGEARLAGSIQGLTAGFGEEAEAAIRAPFSDKTYAQIRDERRATNKQLREADPTSFRGGEWAGGAALGFGTAGLGSLGMLRFAPRAAAAVEGLNPIVRGAVSGGVSGLAGGAAAGAGYSENSPVDKPGAFFLDVVDGAKNAAAAGAAGGAVGGYMGRLVSKAPERVEKAVVGELSRGVSPPTLRKMIPGKTPAQIAEGGKNLRNLVNTDPAVRKAIQAQDVDAAAKAVHTRIEALENRLDPTYSLLDKTERVPVKDVRDRMMAVVQDYDRTSTTKPIADDLLKRTKAFWNKWADPNSKNGGTMRISDLRAEIGAAQSAAFPENQGVAITTGKQALQELSMAQRNSLNDFVDNFLTRNPVQSRQIGGLAAGEVRGVNKEMSQWLNVQEALAQKTRREIAQRESLLDAVKSAPRLAAREANTQMDIALAKLVDAAQGGSSYAQIAKLALEHGVPAAVAQGVYQRFGRKARATDEATQPQGAGQPTP